MNAMAAPLLLAAALGAAGWASAGSPGSAEDLARRIEARHARVSDLTARFVQTYRSGVMGQEVVERGVVSVKRPGRMRWEYRDPERKTFVSDGKTFYFYVPAERQVIVREQDGERSLAGLLLAGRADILSQFEVGLAEAPTGLRRLSLVPRRPEPEIERAFLDVDAEYRIRAIEVEDAQGNRSRFRFDDVREDVSLPEGLFRFEIPRGVEVIAG